jgi:magnesium chelatase family protein
MTAKIVTVAFAGIEARRVDVQVQLAGGLPNLIIVGLADKAVGESRERVRAAFASLGLAMPAGRAIVNLAPADLPKEGAHFDLPIALALMAAIGAVPADALESLLAFGELGLDGKLAPAPGALPAAMAAHAFGLRFLCAAAQGPEAAWSGADVLPAPSLIALVNHFRGNSPLQPAERGPLEPAPAPPNTANIRLTIAQSSSLCMLAAWQRRAPKSPPPLASARCGSILPSTATTRLIGKSC